ncbi:hypothetical protein M1J61_004566 [Escherichia coli]|uniref:hypothetical protein n=1 Tax=Escherichia coli TaxID=562 RepID=UPI0010AC7A65|nr:hypothetical protein [Escherichia coli]EJD1120164.1 hypothetical protein [Escherichia coli]EKK9570463.1 hypothetical protein [Escherichia coli]TJG39786.1 hypothetical protein C9172_23450 [Escherichia coli]
MSQEITLQQAAERAHQIEVICALAEDYPGMMTDSESGAIIGLLKRLSGEVCVFLSDEQERRTLISARSLDKAKNILIADVNG